MRTQATLTEIRDATYVRLRAVQPSDDYRAGKCQACWHPFTAGDSAYLVRGQGMCEACWLYATMPAPMPCPLPPLTDTDRDTVIRLLRDLLKRRSGLDWSVTGGRGTGWGWITITAPPRRRTPSGDLCMADRATLGRLLGLEAPAHQQGYQIADAPDYRRATLERASGHSVSTVPVPYWD